MDAEVAEITPAGRLREPAVHHTTAKESVGGAEKVRKPQKPRPSEGEHCESQGTAARAALTVFSHKDGRRKQAREGKWPQVACSQQTL